MYFVKHIFDSYNDLESKINKFLSAAFDDDTFKLIDIKYQSVYIDHAEDTWDSALIIYQSDEEIYESF